MSATPAVLIVDDNAANRMLLAFVLEHAGIDCQSVESTAAALAVARARAPAVLLLDLWLGDEDGLELLARLRALSNGEHMVAIIVTASVTAEERARAQAASCDVYLTKPFDAPLLVDEVRRALALGRDAVGLPIRPLE